MKFLDRYARNFQRSNFMKIRPLEAQSFHADRWTERHDQAHSPFVQFAKAPNIILRLIIRSV